jgi:hypothetical protein
MREREHARARAIERENRERASRERGERESVCVSERDEVEEHALPIGAYIYKHTSGEN